MFTVIAFSLSSLWIAMGVPGLDAGGMMLAWAAVIGVGLAIDIAIARFIRWMMKSGHVDGIV